MREVHDLLAIRRGLLFRFRVGNLGVARDLDHESVDGCRKMKRPCAGRQIVLGPDSYREEGHRPPIEARRSS